MLDVETVVAATYPLQSTVYNLGNQLTQGDIFLLTFQMFINADSQPSVITISYGGQESDVTQAQANDMCSAAKKLSALGTTIVVSSGDSGELKKISQKFVCGPLPPVSDRHSRSSSSTQLSGVASSDSSTACPPFSPGYPSKYMESEFDSQLAR